MESYGHQRPDQNKLHEDAGTHPGEGWSWFTNISDPERVEQYRDVEGLQVVDKAFDAANGREYNGHAVFETPEHKERRLSNE
jgi:hypothetical protein